MSSSWEFSDGSDQVNDVTSIFKHTKNRPGVPTERINARCDERVIRAIQVMVESGVDPRVKTMSDVVRDALVNWLAVAPERLGIQDTDLGMNITRFIHQERFYYEQSIEERDHEFLASMREAVEKARIRSDYDKLIGLRAHAFKVANRSSDKWFTEAVMGMFKGIVDSDS